MRLIDYGNEVFISAHPVMASNLDRAIEAREELKNLIDELDLWIKRKTE
jgi:hypothetical protein